MNCTSCTAARTTPRAVGHQIDLDRRRDRLLQLGHHRLDGVDQFENVGAGLALDRQPLGRGLVVPGAGAGVLHAVDDIGYVLQPHRRAVAVGDDHVAVGVGREQLVVGIERDGLLGVFENAFGPVDRGRGQRGADVLEPEAAGGERAGIDLNPRRIGPLPEDAGLGHAFYRRYLLRQQRVGVVVDAVDRQRVGMHRIDQHRAVGRVGFSVGRRARQVFGQDAGRRVDRGDHVAGGGVDVARQIELQRDRQRADAAGRGHLVERGDRGELLFERRRHRRGHRVGAGAGVVDRHHDGREVDIGQRRHRQQPVGADAEHQDPQHQQGGGDRPADKGFRDVHGQRLSERLSERRERRSEDRVRVTPRAGWKPVPAPPPSTGIVPRRRPSHRPPGPCRRRRCRPGSRPPRPPGARPCRRAL